MPYLTDKRFISGLKSFILYGLIAFAQILSYRTYKKKKDWTGILRVLKKVKMVGETIIPRWYKKMIKPLFWNLSSKKVKIQKHECNIPVVPQMHIKKSTKSRT